MNLRDYGSGLANILRTPAIRNLTLVIAVRGMAQVGVVLFVPLYLVDVMMFSPEGQGTTMMLMQVGGMVALPYRLPASASLWCPGPRG